ncbi:MAG: tRNA epoxyqueuosine(34) reductase QueG [Terriglobales bacterium]
MNTVPAVTDISDFIKRSVVDLGFDLAGIAPVQEFGELAYFPEWIEEQRHGEMRYLESRTEGGELKRSSIKIAALWAKSVIVCALNYNTSQPYSTEIEDKSRGWISRYAWGQRDYHDAILPKLRELEQRIRKEVMDDAGAARLKPRPFKDEADLRFWSYVDTGPVIERVLAKHAGIGWVAKNTCIINQELGSWLFLGVILTSLELQPDLPPPDRCGTCTRCLDACPTDAFIDAYKLDASKCISYLTIEKRGAIPEDLRHGMGRQVFGCDICQDVCPWNRHAPATATPEFQPRSKLVNSDLEWLATISEEDFRQTFRGSPIKRTKRSGLRRNAVVAIGNSGDSRFLPLLRALESDEDANVAEHAAWARRKLESDSVTRSQAETT